MFKCHPRYFFENIFATVRRELENRKIETRIYLFIATYVSFISQLAFNYSFTLIDNHKWRYYRNCVYYTVIIENNICLVWGQRKELCSIEIPQPILQLIECNCKNCCCKETAERVTLGWIGIYAKNECV